MKKAAIALTILFCACLTMSSCKHKENCDAYKGSRWTAKHHQHR